MTGKDKALTTGIPAQTVVTDPLKKKMILKQPTNLIQRINRSFGKPVIDFNFKSSSTQTVSSILMPNSLGKYTPGSIVNT